MFVVYLIFAWPRHLGDQNPSSIRHGGGAVDIQEADGGGWVKFLTLICMQWTKISAGYTPDGFLGFGLRVEGPFFLALEKGSLWADNSASAPTIYWT